MLANLEDELNRVPNFEQVAADHVDCGPVTRNGRMLSIMATRGRSVMRSTVLGGWQHLVSSHVSLR